ncbi:MAG: DNA recombination protein RmuC, partial [Alphaproteobacteria bacterium]|nr:DNA recombination protein RmuC [Alphaproteobacteria bacterium]
MDIISFFVGSGIGIIIGIMAVLLFRKNNNNSALELERARAIVMTQKQELDKLRLDNQELNREAASRKQEVATLKDVRDKMLNDFKAVSADLIEKQKESVIGTQKTVLGPMQEQMQKLKEGFENKITEILKTTSANKASIDEQIKNMLSHSDSLQKEANNLANALKNKKTQGCWGELYLENILQMLGMVEGVDYTREEFFHVEQDDDEKKKNIRPDFIVNLPNNKRIIIDSKVSMESYLKYENAESDEEREQYANEFMQATEKHIGELSSKEYQKKVKNSGLDFVFMFMPLESAYILAMRKKPDLYASAQKDGVALITSSLLFPMLKTVEMMLKMEKQN